MVMILTPSVPPVYRAMFTIPSVAIENAMACKVFRDIRFGRIEPNGTTFRSTRGGVSSTFDRYPHRPGVLAKDTGITYTTSTTTNVDPSPMSKGHLPVELSLVGPGASRASSSYERNGDVKVQDLEM